MSYKSGVRNAVLLVAIAAVTLTASSVESTGKGRDRSGVVARNSGSIGHLISFAAEGSETPTVGVLASKAGPGLNGSRGVYDYEAVERWCVALYARDATSGEYDFSPDDRLTPECAAE